MPQYPELTWIKEARNHLGLREIKGMKHNLTILAWLKKLKAWWMDDETPWCGTFIAHCLETAGVPYPKNWYQALDYLNYGAKLEKPCYGCVGVKKRKGGGHVTFIVGKTSNGKLVGLGGNQSDMVCYALYDLAEFEAFMWYGFTDRPAQHRYTLPVLTGVTSTKVTEA